MKKERGITLIALIITLIVMIILVGVTVNVALNGGLFTTAKDAANKTQTEIDRESLLSAAIGAIGDNGEVDFTKLDANLPEGFTGSNGTYMKNGNTYKIDKYGNVTYKEPSTGDLLLLEKYFLGENGEGKDLQSIITDTGFKDDESTIPDASTSLILLGAGGDNDGYIKYNNKFYKITLSDNNRTKEVELIYEPQGREGEIVKYDSDSDGTEEDWMILYDNGNNVEIISIQNMGELTLGKDDIEAQGETDLEKAIYSYNNAISRLNNYCASLITNENKISVRSAGSNPDNPSSENSNMFKSAGLENFAGGKYNGIGKGEDSNFEQDYIRMLCFEINNTGNGYWMASRDTPTDVSEYSGPSFYIRYVNTEGNFDVYRSIWAILLNGEADLHYDTTNAVRPIVKLSNI